MKREPLSFVWWPARGSPGQDAQGNGADGHTGQGGPPQRTPGGARGVRAPGPCILTSLLLPTSWRWDWWPQNCPNFYLCYTTVPITIR